MSRVAVSLLALFLLLAPATAVADDLTGADALLCAATVVVACNELGDCGEGLPEELNVPPFVEVDLAGKMLRTTKASEENRVTPIGKVTREGGQIVVQGYEAGRAFSWVVSESTGRATVSIARDGLGVTVFGTCTPLPSTR